MKLNRTLIIRIAAVAALIAIAVCMLIIGRGHTVYVDNVTTEYNGQTFSAFHKVEVTVKGERIAKLMKRERGMTTNIGDRIRMDLAVTEEKGGDEVVYSVNLKLPHNIDGVIVNLPALLAGQPQEAWISEFVETVVEETEPIETDDGMGMDDGFSLE